MVCGLRRAGWSAIERHVIHQARLADRPAVDNLLNAATRKNQAAPAPLAKLTAMRRERALFRFFLAAPKRGADESDNFKSSTDKELIQQQGSGRRRLAL